MEKADKNPHTRKVLVNLVNGARRMRVEIAPGKPVEARDIPREAVPRFAVMCLARAADGSILPLLNHYGQFVRLTYDLGRVIGMDFSYRTLVRLIVAGFVKATQPAPRTYLVDLASLLDHVRACEDPDFWTPERKERYRRAVV